MTNKTPVPRLGKNFQKTLSQSVIHGAEEGRTPCQLQRLLNGWAAFSCNCLMFRFLVRWWSYSWVARNKGMNTATSVETHAPWRSHEQQPVRDPVSMSKPRWSLCVHVTWLTGDETWKDVIGWRDHCISDAQLVELTYQGLTVNGESGQQGRRGKSDDLNYKEYEWGEF